MAVNEVDAQYIPQASANPTEPDFRKIDTIRPYIDMLITKWRGDVDRKLEENRILRRCWVDIESLKNKGSLQPHETYISVRTIDLNITSKMPAHVAYLTQPRRLAIFVPDDPALLGAKERLEEEFTRVMKYSEWEADYIKWLDATKLHGFGWTRLKFDAKQPGAVRVQFVPTENLIFDQRVFCLQDSKLVMQRYPLTMVSFDELVKANQFDPKESQLIREQLRSLRQSETTEFTWVYEIFFKQGDFVYRGWYYKDSGKWLQEPRPFYNGVDEKTMQMSPIPGAMMAAPIETWTPVYETAYPFYGMLYRVTENEQLIEQEGQAKLDYYKQDAACTLWSTFVNGCLRASRVMWSPKQPNTDASGAAPKQLAVQIKDGAIWDTPMEAFSAPWPDTMLPRALDLLATHNSIENADIAWGVNNRKDSRKTATEVMGAKEQQTLVSGVDVLMVSMSLRALFTGAWRIVQSQAAQGNIRFCVNAQGVNEVQLIGGSYQVRASGDNDFVEKNERSMMMQQDWAVFQNTPLRDAFLEEYILLRYPNQAPKLLEALRTAKQQDKQLIASLSQMLQQAITDESGAIRPEWQQFAPQLQQIATSVQQATAGEVGGPTNAKQQ